MASMPTQKPDKAKPQVKSVITQYDAATITKVLNSELPDFVIQSITIIETGWDHLVAEVNRKWIFRFPRTTGSIANLEREKNLLGYLEDRITLPIPHYQYVGTDVAFVGYCKIPGIHLNRQVYKSLDREARQNIAETLALFFTQLHRAVNKDQALHMGYMTISRPIQEIESTLLNTLPADVAIMVQKAIDYTRNELSKEQALVFVHQDVSGDNMALDATTKQITGVFDFSDVGIGSCSLEFAELFGIDAQLARLAAEIYAKMNNVPNPLIGGATDYILRKATQILWARNEGNAQSATNLLKDLSDFVPVWQGLLTQNI